MLGNPCTTKHEDDVRCLLLIGIFQSSCVPSLNSKGGTTELATMSFRIVEAGTADVLQPSCFHFGLHPFQMSVNSFPGQNFCPFSDRLGDFRNEGHCSMFTTSEF